MALWAKWTGEGLTAGTIPDQSGNGRDLTNYGVSQVAVSPFTPGGVALDFVTDARAADTSLSLPTGDCVVAFWIQPQDYNKVYLSGGAANLELYAYGSGTGFSFRAEGQTLSMTPMAIDSNSAVVFQISAAGLELYVNDMTTPAASGAGVSFDVTGLTLGGRGDLGSPYAMDGYLGNVSVYDAWLTESERQSWMATGSVSPAAPVSESAAVSGNRFLLTLTGSADGTTDAVIPMSNINARLRSGSNSYLQVALPYTDDIAAAVSARPNGDLQLAYVDGSESNDVVDVALETIQISRGSESASIVLTGHRQNTNSSPASHTVTPLSLQTGTNSTTAIIPGYDPLIKPADDVTAEGTTYRVDTVSIQASARSIQTQLIGS